MDYMELLDVLFRSFISLLTLFILAKLMGKKQISQLNLYDYIIGITIGSIAADISLDTQKQLLDGIISMAVYGLSAAFISFITTKSIKLRRFFTGVPTILIEKGNIIENGLKKVKFDINDLLEETRVAGYFNLDEIDYAIMETSGRISFLPKAKNKPTTNKDMGIEVDDEGLVANVIIDGNIMIHNLEASNKNEKWLNQQLKVQGYKKLDNILLATLDKNEKLIIYPKNKKSTLRTILE